MRRIFILLGGLLACAASLAAEPLSQGFSDRLESRILGEKRHYSVYLPPSYQLAPTARFPVIYLIDGDYHFPYVPGLIEQLSVAGEQIPEAIVIAVGENGKAAYRREVVPALGKGGGEAAKLREFLARELIPEIDRRYRTTSYRILLGQSLAGLFALDTLIEQPELFSAYVAISPSLWWEDYVLRAKAEAAFKAKSDWKARLYLSQGNERGMGVLEFAGLLERSAPSAPAFKFTRFENDNHGSVMIPALTWSLRQEFAGFEMTSERFRGFAGAEDFLAHYRQLKTRLGFEFLLPPGLFSNTLYAYQGEKKTADIAHLEQGIAREFPASLPVLRLTEAELALDAGQNAEALQHCRAAAPARRFESHWCAARALQALGKTAEAKQEMARARTLAPALGLRQWRWNQLDADTRALDAGAR